MYHVYMYICIYIYIYICMDIYAYIYMYICTCIYIYVCVYTYVLIHIYTHVYINTTYKYINQHNYTYTNLTRSKETDLAPPHSRFKLHISHTWVIHVPHPYHTHEWFTSHIHITHMSDSRPTSTRQTKRIHEPCHTTRTDIHTRGVWSIPLKMLHPRSPPNPQTQIPRYKFKFNQHLNLNLYREIPRKLRFSKWRISDVQHFQWKQSK